MPESKKRKFERKIAKRYEFVKFESEIFDTEFEFPKLDMAPLRVVEALNTGEVQKVSKWLEDAGADPDAIEAYRDLDREELMDFIKAWESGQLASVPK
ncbi:hypothetical protein [Glutamicibacter halophytocola]|uniref:Uncharacterized protein n=1 Tax=Glutamicibacter halophytocola TaxID=1933880 RepID=A0AA95BRB7_9MICC|nr:hypothetical protein [Glutamicibacter halophytocola]UUX60176.1 hypothetical protein NUH22_06070 [Glutamicibacter halophytocola]